LVLYPNATVLDPEQMEPITNLVELKSGKITFSTDSDDEEGTFDSDVVIE
jgi:hypothetical protein